MPRYVEFKQKSSCGGECLVTTDAETIHTVYQCYDSNLTGLMFYNNEKLEVSNPYAEVLDILGLERGEDGRIKPKPVEWKWMPPVKNPLAGVMAQKAIPTGQPAERPEPKYKKGDALDCGGSVALHVSRIEWDSGEERWRYYNDLGYSWSERYVRGLWVEIPDPKYKEGDVVKYKFDGEDGIATRLPTKIINVSRYARMNNGDFDYVYNANTGAGIFELFEHEIIGLADPEDAK